MTSTRVEEITSVNFKQATNGSDEGNFKSGDKDSDEGSSK